MQLLYYHYDDSKKKNIKEEEEEDWVQSVTHKEEENIYYCMFLWPQYNKLVSAQWKHLVHTLDITKQQRNFSELQNGVRLGFMMYSCDFSVNVKL